MSNALMTKPVEFEVNGEEVKLTGETVKNYLVSGKGEINDQELVMFINLCKYQKLNPFLKEAYLVKYGSQPAQIIVSKEAFMKRAEKHPNYEGFEAGVVVDREGELIEIEGAIKLPKDELIGGWAKVYRSDRKKPVTAKILLDEFGKGQATWKDMPLNMIRKSAIVNAQREAFPETLGALYTEDDAENNSQNQSAEQEIQQKANSEVLDFEETEEKPKKETIEVTEKDIQDVEQSDLFSNSSEDGPGF